MKAKIEIGGEIDVVTKDELDDSLGLWGNNIVDKILKEKDTFIARRRSNSVVATGTQTVVGLGGPAEGRYWEVRVITACVLNPASPDFTGALADGSKVASFVGDAAVGPSIADLIDPATATPNSSGWGSRELVVQENERLYLVFTGCTTNYNYVGNARYLEHTARHEIARNIR